MNVRDIVRQTRAAQGLSPSISDETALRRIAELVAGDGYPVATAASISAGHQASPREGTRLSNSTGKGAGGGAAEAGAVGAVKASGNGSATTNGKGSRTSLCSVPSDSDPNRSDPFSAVKFHNERP